MKVKRKNFNLKNVGLVLLFICVEIFLINFTQLFFPNANIILKLSEDSEIENVWVCEKNDVQEVVFSKQETDTWEGFVSNDYFNLQEHFTVDIKNNLAMSIENNYPIRLVDIGKIHELGSQKELYSHVQVMVVYNNLFKQISILAICNIVLILVALLIKKNMVDLADIFENFIFNTTSLKIVGKRAIITSIILSVLLIVVKPGGDCWAISYALAVNLSGVDVYQVQNIIEIYLNNIEFVTWPYNPIMLMIYSFTEILALRYPPFYWKSTFELFPAILLKVMNIVLMNAIVLGILSFMLEYDMIQSRNVRKIYFWSIFNPLVFYIAIIYIQLDILPIYCVCMGLLLFSKKDFKIYTGVIASVLLAVGMACKMQNILMMPVIILFMFMLALRNRKKIFYMMLTIVLFSVSILNIYVTNDVIGSFLGANKQAERIWYTTLGYAPAIYLYITIFAIVLFFLLNVFHYNSKIKTNYLVCNAMFMIGGIALIFSATIIATPSTLCVTFPAFVLCISIEDNWVKRMVITLFSILCVMDVMFVSIGDITASFNYIGKEGVFTQLEKQLAGTPEGVKWFSILFSIAKAAMIAYGVLFYKYGTGILVEKNEI